MSKTLPAYKSLVELVRPKEGLFMRLEDTLLEPEEAEALTSQMHKLIKYDLEEPGHSRHLTAFRMSSEYHERQKRGLEETDEEYLDRMDRVTTWLERSTSEEARWIWRAQVVIEAMKFLHNESGGDYTKLRMPRKYSFNPKNFYYYSWICLREGFGVRSWKAFPPLPPGDLSILEKTEWFCEKARQDQERVLARWHEGMKLRDITGEWTLKGLSGSAPYWLETIETVKKKVQENTDISHPAQAHEPGTKKRADENRLSTNELRAKRIKID